MPLEAGVNGIPVAVLLPEWSASGIQPVMLLR